MCEESQVFYKNKNNLIFKPFFLLILISNINFHLSEITRPIEDIHTISDKIIQMIKNKKTEDNLCEINIDNYIFQIKIHHNILNYDKIIYEKNSFTLVTPNFDLIISLYINKDNSFSFKEFPNISLKSNGYLKFQLEYLSINIKSRFLEFSRLEDNTFKNIFFYNKEPIDKYKDNPCEQSIIGNEDISVNINLKKYKNYQKVNYLLDKNFDKLKDFLFKSLCLSINDVLKTYPISDGVYIFNKMIEKMKLIGVFKMSLEKDPTIIQVVVNEIRPGLYEKISSSIIIFTDISMRIEIRHDNEKLDRSIGIIIKEIYLNKNIFIIGKEIEPESPLIWDLVNELFLRIKTIL